MRKASEYDYIVHKGETFEDGLNFADNSVINIIDCFFARIISEQSGGAVRISGYNCYALVRDSTFTECQTKAQGACIYFNGNRIETFRCCSINCTSRYANTFLSCALSILKNDARSTCDMVTVFNGYSQVNAISVQNHESLITNVNISKCTASSASIAIEHINLNRGRLAFFTIEENNDRSSVSSILYFHNDDYPESSLIEYGNIVNNKGINGGYIFSFSEEITVSNVICMNNQRAIINAIRYYVTFDSCIFDGSDTLTDVVRTTNCQFLTETSTFDFTFHECNCFEEVKLRMGRKNESGNYRKLMTVGIAGVAVLAVIVVGAVFVSMKKKENDEKDFQEEEVSAVPLIE